MRIKRHRVESIDIRILPTCSCSNSCSTTSGILTGPCGMLPRCSRLVLISWTSRDSRTRILTDSSALLSSVLTNAASARNSWSAASAAYSSSSRVVLTYLISWDKRVGCIGLKLHKHEIQTCSRILTSSSGMLPCTRSRIMIPRYTTSRDM